MENRVKVRWALGQRCFWGVLLPLLVAALLACAAERGTIGAVLGQRPDGRLFVRETPSELAAARRGLAPGDEILLVDGRDVRQMSERELYGALSGDVGAKVSLTVVRGEAVMRVTLARTPAPRGKSAGAR